MDALSLKHNWTNGQVWDELIHNADMEAIETAVNILTQNVTDGNSGADHLAVTPITALSPSIVKLQPMLEAMYTAMVNVVLGQITNGSIGTEKLSFDVATQAELDALSGTGNTHTVKEAYDLAVSVTAPTGTVIFYAKNSAPTGYVKANGAAISRTTYSALFSAIGTTFGVGDGSTTFNVPDMRGLFPRGWVDDGTYDSGRVFGSYQADDVKAHGHTFTTGSGGEHTHGLNLSGLFIGSGTPASFVDGAGNEAITGSSGSHTHTGTTDNNGTATETIVKNLALLACIKY